jgi:hypothetical protein
LSTVKNNLIEKNKNNILLDADDSESQKFERFSENEPKKNNK